MAQKPLSPDEDVKFIALRATASMEAACRSKAKELGLTRSELIRTAIERFLDDPEVAA